MLWKLYGPQTLQEACAFVRRVAELQAENTFTEKEAVQQILVNAARDAFWKEGATKFDCSVSESSDTEPQSKVEQTKKWSSNEKESKIKAKSNRGGSSWGTP